MAPTAVSSLDGTLVPVPRYLLRGPRRLTRGPHNLADGNGGPCCVALEKLSILELELVSVVAHETSPYQAMSQSPLILACLKYFIPTQATTTQTQAMTPVNMINAG